MGIAAISEVYELEDTAACMEVIGRKWDESNSGRGSQGGRLEEKNGGR